jgi:hypothetical protein
MSQFTQTAIDTDSNILRPPSRVSEPIIQMAIINFHDTRIAVPDCLIPHHNLEERFGIVSINVRNEIPIISEILFQCTVDCSGSMSDPCADGRTKMAHIIHTLENMIRIFHKKAGSKISIRIQSFDSKVYVNIDTIEDLGQKTQEEIEEIILKVKQIAPQGSTNIEKALKATTTYLDQYIKDHPSAHVAHLLLTDGEITDGSSDKTYLKTLVSNVYPNIFMGYGLQHDNILLTSLASTGLHNEYRLVDNLEKAGLVYGEVIHQLLYPALEDVTLKAEGCEIYNYATNTWTTTLDVGHLVGEQQKIFQIRTTTPKEAHVAIYGRTIHQTKHNEVLSNDIIFQTHALPVPQALEPCDLTNYLFRQKTQELLFATKELLERQHNLDYNLDDPFDKYAALYAPQTKAQDKFEEFKKQKAELKQKMKDFFKTMLDHIEARNLKADTFLKTLCDDIYIAIKSFDTQHGLMYTAARQTSQGRQQTYSCRPATQEPDEEQDFLLDPNADPLSSMPRATPRMTRGFSLMTPAPLTRCLTQGVGSNQRSLIPPIAVTKDDLDSDLGMKYELSQDDTSGYTSLGVLKMMREVSYQPPMQDKDKDLIPDEALNLHLP